MPLDPGTLLEAGNAFSDALRATADARRVLEDQLDQLAGSLPAAETWAALGEGDNAILALLAGDLLLTISRETPSDGEPELVVTGRPVRIAECRYRQKGQHTTWDFEFLDRGPMRIEGRVLAETPDRPEAFARALAASIGWPIAGEPPAAPEEPDEEEPTVPGSSPAGDADRERLTDIWGNPLSERRVSKRRRRRG